VIDALRALVDEMAGREPTEWADSDTVVALQRELSRLEAAVARVTTAWDSSGVWADDGARSGAVWLEHRTKLSKKAAARQIRLGRLARELAAVDDAWVSGRIGAGQVDVLGLHHRPVTHEAMIRDQELLVGQAAGLPHRLFVKAAAYWRQHADPDGVERDAARLYDQRELSMGETLDGAAVGHFVLDPIGGGIVRTVLGDIEQELFEADWADARTQHGKDACKNHLRRSARQRRADALVEMARRAAIAPEDGRDPYVLLTVLIGHDTVNRLCELANGNVVTPGSLLPWLQDACLERIVFDGPSRAIDVGVRQRLFKGATRRAIEVRDRECFHPLCDRPAPECQADHVIPYSAGGPTTQDNGRLACPHHNRSRHDNPYEQGKKESKRTKRERPPP
jgi:hypothetical protein